jgi:hypothetical protein
VNRSVWSSKAEVVCEGPATASIVALDRTRGEVRCLVAGVPTTTAGTVIALFALRLPAFFALSGSRVFFVFGAYLYSGCRAACSAFSRAARSCHGHRSAADMCAQIAESVLLTCMPDSPVRMTCGTIEVRKRIHAFAGRGIWPSGGARLPLRDRVVEERGAGAGSVGAAATAESSTDAASTRGRSMIVVGDGGDGQYSEDVRVVEHERGDQQSNRDDVLVRDAFEYSEVVSSTVGEHGTVRIA